MKPQTKRLISVGVCLVFILSIIIAILYACDVFGKKGTIISPPPDETKPKPIITIQDLEKVASALQTLKIDPRKPSSLKKGGASITNFDELNRNRELFISEYYQVIENEKRNNPQHLKLIIPPISNPGEMPSPEQLILDPRALPALSESDFNILLKANKRPSANKVKEYILKLNDFNTLFDLIMDSEIGKVQASLSNRKSPFIHITEWGPKSEFQTNSFTLNLFSLILLLNDRIESYSSKSNLINDISNMFFGYFFNVTKQLVEKNRVLIEALSGEKFPINFGNIDEIRTLGIAMLESVITDENFAQLKSLVLQIFSDELYYIIWNFSSLIINFPSFESLDYSAFDSRFLDEAQRAIFLIFQPRYERQIKISPGAFDVLSKILKSQQMVDALNQVCRNGGSIYQPILSANSPEILINRLLELKRKFENIPAIATIVLALQEPITLRLENIIKPLISVSNDLKFFLIRKFIFNVHRILTTLGPNTDLSELINEVYSSLSKGGRVKIIAGIFPTEQEPSTKELSIEEKLKAIRSILQYIYAVKRGVFSPKILITKFLSLLPKESKDRQFLLHRCMIFAYRIIPHFLWAMESLENQLDLSIINLFFKSLGFSFNSILQGLFRAASTD